MHRRHGHEVLVAASDEVILNGEYTHTRPGEFVTDSGITVRRLSPAGYIPAPLRYKLRFFPGFAPLLEDYSPDVIFFHSVAAHELLIAAGYKKKHPKTALLVDSHASLGNSAGNIIAMTLQHKGYYRSIYERVRGGLDALYYIGINERDYLRDILGVKPEDMSFLPLGGMIPDGAEAAEIRQKIRNRHHIPDNSFTLCFSGKIGAAKRPETVLRAMELCPDERLRLFIVGSASGEYLDMITKAADSDSRLIYTGWQTADSLREYILASDAYVLAGSVSATLQTALCCGIPALVAEQYTYREQFGEDNGVLFFDTPEQLADIIGDMASGTVDAKALSRQALGYSREHLDYDRQARLIESFAQ